MQQEEEWRPNGGAALLQFYRVNHFQTPPHPHWASPALLSHTEAIISVSSCSVSLQFIHPNSTSLSLYLWRPACHLQPSLVCSPALIDLCEDPPQSPEVLLLASFFFDLALKNPPFTVFIVGLSSWLMQAAQMGVFSPGVLGGKAVLQPGDAETDVSVAPPAGTIIDLRGVCTEDVRQRWEGGPLKRNVFRPELHSRTDSLYCAV